MADNKEKASGDANKPVDPEPAERLTPPAMELELRRQKIQNEVKQSGAGKDEAEKHANPDG